MGRVPTGEFSTGDINLAQGNAIDRSTDIEELNDEWAAVNPTWFTAGAYANLGVDRWEGRLFGYEGIPVPSSLNCSRVINYDGTDTFNFSWASTSTATRWRLWVRDSRGSSNYTNLTAWTTATSASWTRDSAPVGGINGYVEFENQNKLVGNNTAVSNTTAFNTSNYVPDTTPPSVPGAQFLNWAGTPTSLTVTWSPSTDNVTSQSNMSYYYGFYSIGPAGLLIQQDTVVNITSVTFTGLLPDTTYYIKIAAIDQAGNSSAFNEDYQDTLPEPITGVPVSSFIMSGNNQTTSSLACSGLTPTDQYFHDGTGSIPTIGDTIYTDNPGNNTLNGQSRWWTADVPGLNSQALLVTGSGVVTSMFSCRDGGGQEQ